MSRLVQIVPGRQAPTEALAQIASRLAAALGDLSDPELPPIASAARRSDLRTVLDRARATDVALLHYVGYGYARRGAPTWLARLLREWRSKEPRRRLLVHFHEVSAFGPPWRSSFWLAPLQRRIAARLGRLAAGAVTSLETYAALIRRLAPGLRVEVLPIFSAVGEPGVLAPLRQRRPALVVFGSREARREIWDCHASDLETVLRTLGLDRVIEIGSGPCGPPELGGRPVARLGEVESARVVEILVESRAAFFGYPLDYLDKSSAFAAACAHGLLPICGSRRSRVMAAAGEGERWLPLLALGTVSETGLETIARNGRHWYEGHDLRRHVETWRELLSR